MGGAAALWNIPVGHSGIDTHTRFEFSLRWRILPMQPIHWLNCVCVLKLRVGVFVLVDAGSFYSTTTFIKNDGQGKVFRSS
jgi:hypothetical protein